MNREYTLKESKEILKDYFNTLRKKQGINSAEDIITCAHIECKECLLQSECANSRHLVFFGRITDEHIYKLSLETAQLQELENRKKKDDYWKNVKVDTPLLVADKMTPDKKKLRYFSHYENGNVYAFNEGRTSWTIKELDSCWWTAPWEHAEVYKDEVDK